MMTECYRRSDKALHSELGRDVVALHIDRGHCYGMENVSAEVWRLLAEPMNLDQLCDRLTNIYEVDPSTCRDEVGTLIDQMKAEGLIEIDA